MVRPRSGRFEPLLPVSEPGGEAIEEGVDDNLRMEALSGEGDEGDAEEETEQRRNGAGVSRKKGARESVRS